METRLRRDSEPSQITSRRPTTNRILGGPASRQFLCQPNQLSRKLLSRAPQPGRLFARPPGPPTPSHILNGPNRPQNPVLFILHRDGLPRAGAVAGAGATGPAAALPLPLHHRSLELAESPRESCRQNRPIDLEQGLGPLLLVLIDEPLGQGPDGLVLAGAHGDVVDDGEELRQRAGDAGVARGGVGRRGAGAAAGGGLRGPEEGAAVMGGGGGGGASGGGEEGREEAEEEEEGGEDEVAEELEEAVLLGEAEEGLVGEDEGGSDEVAEEERRDGGEGVESFHGGRGVAVADRRAAVHGGIT